MTPLESLALLLADMHQQLQAVAAENHQFRQQLEAETASQGEAPSSIPEVDDAQADK